MERGGFSLTSRAFAVAAAGLVAAALVVTPAQAQSPEGECSGVYDDVGLACPDLAIAGDVTPSFTEQTVVFTLEVANQGRADSPGGDAVALGTEFEAHGDLPPLKVGEAAPLVIEASIPADLSGKEETVRIILDPANQIAEDDGGNNERSVAVSYPLLEPTTSETTLSETSSTESTATDDTTTVPTTTDTGGSSSSGGHWLIWGLAIGGGVLVAAVIALTLVSRRRRFGDDLFEEQVSRDRKYHRVRERRDTWREMDEYRAEPEGTAVEEAAAEPEAAEANGGATAAPPSPAPPPAASSTESLPRRARERYVNTGFAPSATPDTALTSHTPLRPGGSYFFWLEVGELAKDSIEEVSVELLEIDEFPPETRLAVVLFPLGLPAETQEGELTLLRDGSVGVSKQPTRDIDLPKESPLLERRLFFPVEVPDEEETLHFRCSIYHEQVLLQSRLITARVAAGEVAIERALRSTLDFTLAPRLDPRHVARIPPYRLSLLLNQTDEGTHALTVKGERFSDAATLDPLELQDFVERARSRMRLAAWGTELPWQKGDPYLYEQPSREQLRKDLVSFALAGKRFYVMLCRPLAGAKSRHELEAATETPGYIQVALKQSPRHLIPAALLYDGGLSDTARPEEYSICPDFLAALGDDLPLDQAACFRGTCEHRKEKTVVCPSGFWGYRHALGIPLTLKDAPDVPPTITYSGSPSMSVAVCTDPSFVLRADHELELRKLRPNLRYAATLADALLLLAEPSSDVIYFYCHGGVDGVPYIRVGPLTDEAITATTLFNEDICWSKPRPLVFLNGCHTIGLEPEQAFELVSAIVSNAQAAGVLGTEITVFEPMARTFAEEFLGRFLSGAPIGWAVRDARLALLKSLNPLGLVYLPYALPSLQLVQAQ